MRGTVEVAYGTATRHPHARPLPDKMVGTSTSYVLTRYGTYIPAERGEAEDEPGSAGRSGLGSIDRSRESTTTGGGTDGVGGERGMESTCRVGASRGPEEFGRVDQMECGGWREARRREVGGQSAMQPLSCTSTVRTPRCLCTMNLLLCLRAFFIRPG